MWGKAKDVGKTASSLAASASTTTTASTAAKAVNSTKAAVANSSSIAESISNLKMPENIKNEITKAKDPVVKFLKHNGKTTITYPSNDVFTEILVFDKAGNYSQRITKSSLGHTVTGADGNIIKTLEKTANGFKTTLFDGVEKIKGAINPNAVKQIELNKFNYGDGLKGTQIHRQIFDFSKDASGLKARVPVGGQTTDIIKDGERWFTVLNQRFKKGTPTLSKAKVNGEWLIPNRANGQILQDVLPKDKFDLWVKARNSINIL